MKQHLSALLIVSCFLGLSAGTVSAQKRYKHLKHARTPEGKVVVADARKSRPEIPTPEDPETLKPITAEAFTAPEAEPVPVDHDLNLTVSAAESAQRLLSAKRLPFRSSEEKLTMC